jgi:rhamnose utilization protein RhaD (predicted bifunctional aldolase and dehydrogenase)
VGSEIDLVQLSGGNTSFKNNSKLWVKGSGFILKNALSENIFAELDLLDISASKDFLAIEDFQDFCLNKVSPSIETNFHILLRSPYVTHVHSLGAISIGILTSEIRSKFLSSDVSFVPYVKPGVALARAIQATSGHQSKTLVLQNHGAIFTGNSGKEIEVKVQAFESSVKVYLALQKSEPNFPDWSEILISGVLTPDEAVFLGRKPFVRSEEAVKDSVCINTQGDLLFPEGFSNDRIAMANFYVRVAKLIEKKSLVSYLSIAEVDSILDWDKERLRIAMAE